jgi:hypothetical protein
MIFKQVVVYHLFGREKTAYAVQKIKIGDLRKKVDITDRTLCYRQSKSNLAGT